MTLTPGISLGPYEIVGPLGAGGMGEVYRARDAKLRRDVAVKVLPSHLSEDPAALARFEREAQVVAALSHPNILAIHDFGRHGATVYAVMELLEGESLRTRLGAGPLPARKAVDYALQIAHGLAAAHEKGVVPPGPQAGQPLCHETGASRSSTSALPSRLRPPAETTPTRPPCPATRTRARSWAPWVTCPRNKVRGKPADQRSR